MKPTSPRVLNADGLPEPQNLFRQSVSLIGGQIHILPDAQKLGQLSSIDGATKSPKSARHSAKNTDPTAPSPLKSLLTGSPRNVIADVAYLFLDQDSTYQIRRPLVSLYSSSLLFDNSQTSPDYGTVMRLLSNRSDFRFLFFFLKT